jgi:tetratricopeptide (TPR) repeat protein
LYAALLVAIAAFGISRYVQNRQDADMASKHRAVEIDGEPDADMASGAPNALSLSKWLSARTQRYHSLLQGWNCSLLVVPVQVEGMGFDRPTRYLMSADIAHVLATNNQCIADPLLIDRALGEGLRRHEPGEIAKLAHEINATTMVETWAGHDRHGHMRITMQVAHLSPQTGQPVILAKKSFTDLVYTDSISPFAAFDKDLNRILHDVGIESQAAPPQSAGSSSQEIPESPKSLTQIGGASALDKAERLTLLGMLSPPNDSPTADRLFTKAWFNLVDVKDGNPRVDLLRGRILLHLHERPYALKAIAGIQGPEADGVRAILNGNLPSARAALGKTSEPWEKVFLGIETYDLELNYQRDGNSTAAAIMAALGPHWADLITARRADDDDWIVPNLIALKQSLDETFPIAGQSLRDLTQGNAVIAQMGDPATYDLFAIKHVHELLQSHPQTWCCSTFNVQPTQFDVLDFYENRTERSMVEEASYFVSPQGLYQRALDSLSRYDDELAGNPFAEEVRARAGWYLRQQGGIQNRDSLNGRIHDAARVAVVAAPGQTWPAISALWYLHQPPVESFAHALGDAYCEDFPIRPDWTGTPDTLKPRLEFSTSDFAPLQALLESSKGDEHKKFVAELEHRFDGNASATKWRLKEAAGTGDVEPPALMKAIAEDPDNWNLYAWLANNYIRGGQYDQASALAQSFPSFKQPKSRTVELSAHAFVIGNNLYYQGAINAARPLLKIAADYDNGAASSVLARAHLALLDDDYTTAALSFLEAGRHYSDLGAYRDYLYLLFAGGESQAAWNGFDQLVRRFRGVQPWAAAVVGHRRDDISALDLRKWILDQAHHHPTGDQAVATYALMESMIDRPAPSQDFVELVTESAGPSNVHAARDGKSFIGKTTADQEYRIGPSEFVHGKHDPIASDGVVPNRFALFADAYADLRSKQFEKSAIAFNRLASYYDIESTPGWGFALPYFAFAAAQSGDTLGLEAYLDSIKTQHLPWGVLLAKAIFAGVHNHYDVSAQLLDKAFADRPSTGSWPVTTSYQYAEICTRLYELTKDDHYRNRALTWARAFEKIEPAQAWGHALVARLSTDPSERLHALAIALYLDPQSRWANDLPKSMRSEAAKSIEKNKPFRLQPHGDSI